MRGRESLVAVVVAALFLVLIPCLARGAGTPKQLWGAVRYSDGSIPLGGGAEITGTAWILTHPGESVTVTAWYDPGDNECYASAEIGDMPTPWAVGETAAVELTGDGMHHGGVLETNTLYVVLDASWSQNWGIFYLPLELTSFTAEGGFGCAVIRWTTATESDNLGFWLWRSSQAAGAYIQVNEALIRGAGTSTRPHSYVYADEGLAASSYRYKLQDVAANGATQFHGPIEVTVLPVSCGLAAVTPNPVSDRALIRLEMPRRTPVRLAIYDVRGALVATLVDATLDAGSHTQEWSTEALPRGGYVCRLEVGRSSAGQRIVVVEQLRKPGR